MLNDDGDAVAAPGTVRTRVAVHPWQGTPTRWKGPSAANGAEPQSVCPRHHALSAAHERAPLQVLSVTSDWRKMIWPMLDCQARSVAVSATSVAAGATGG